MGEQLTPEELDADDTKLTRLILALYKTAPYDVARSLDRYILRLRAERAVAQGHIK